MTDITSEKSLCIVIRYFDKVSASVRDSLFDIVKVYNGNKKQKGDSTTLTNKILSSFESSNIPISSIDGFCSDMASVMMGKHNSISQKLLELNPNMKIIKCGAHIQHLSCHKAMT